MSKEEEVLMEVREDALPFDTQGSKYDDPEIVAYIIENYNRGKNFKEITDELKERGYPKIARQTVSELYSKAVAKATITRTARKEYFDDFMEPIVQNYGEAVTLMGEYVKLLRSYLQQLKDKMNDLDEDDLKLKSEIIKSIPYATGVMKEIRAIAETQMDMQDKIQAERSQMGMTEGDMVSFINKYLPILEKSGKIKILDPIIK